MCIKCFAGHPDQQVYLVLNRQSSCYRIMHDALKDYTVLINIYATCLMVVILVKKKCYKVKY